MPDNYGEQRNLNLIQRACAAHRIGIAHQTLASEARKNSVGGALTVCASSTAGNEEAIHDDGRLSRKIHDDTVDFNSSLDTRQHLPSCPSQIKTLKDDNPVNLQGASCLNIKADSRHLIQNPTTGPSTSSHSNTPKKVKMVTIQHRDGIATPGVSSTPPLNDHKKFLIDEYATPPAIYEPPTSYSNTSTSYAAYSHSTTSYDNPFGDLSPIVSTLPTVNMPTARPHMPPSSFSQSLTPGYTSGGGLVRKVSTRIQQAIEAAKVPYQPVYPATQDEGGDLGGRSVDLHGELRDEWEAPISAERIPLKYSKVDINDRYTRIPDEFEIKDEPKIEQSEDEKYLVSYALDDMRHPYNWPKSKKYTILLVLCLAAVCVTATSSIQASTYASIEREFNFSRPEAVLGVSLYVLGLGLGSSEFNGGLELTIVFLGPMSEFFGRCYIYLVSFFLFTICNIPIATAQNGGVFLFFRLLTGLCGSGFLSIAGGR